MSVIDSITGAHDVQIAAWFKDEGWVLDHSDEGDFVVLGWMDLPQPL